MCWDLIAIFNFLNIRMRVNIFGTEKCKVTFGLEYIFVLRMATNDLNILALHMSI